MLIQCLQTYASINQCQAAESLFQILVVHPYMDKVSVHDIVFLMQFPFDVVIWNVGFKHVRNREPL